MTAQGWALLFTSALVVSSVTAGLAWRRRAGNRAASALAVTMLGVASWSAVDAALHGLDSALVRTLYPPVLLGSVGVAVGGIYALSRVVANPSWRPTWRRTGLLAVEPVLLVIASSLPATRDLVLSADGAAGSRHRRGGHAGPVVPGAHPLLLRRHRRGLLAPGSLLADHDGGLPPSDHRPARRGGLLDRRQRGHDRHPDLGQRCRRDPAVLPVHRRRPRLGPAADGSAAADPRGPRAGGGHRPRRRPGHRPGRHPHRPQPRRAAGCWRACGPTSRVRTWSAVRCPWSPAATRSRSWPVPSASTGTAWSRCGPGCGWTSGTPR